MQAAVLHKSYQIFVGQGQISFDFQMFFLCHLTDVLTIPYKSDKPAESKKKL